MKYIILVVCCFFMHAVCAQSDSKKVEVFSLHPCAICVSLFNDADRTSKRLDIYPYFEESMAGLIFLLDHETENSLCVYLGELEILYVAKGSLAVNTRNYNDDPFYLYVDPDMSSKIVFTSFEQQTVAVFGIRQGWLYVNAISEDGDNVKGWLPPNMQCGNPYTSCN